MIEDNDNAKMEETPVKPDTVVFLSPSAKLLVNLHLRPQRKYSSGGVTIIEEEVARIQFMDGRYETSDQREIELLREAPNNVTVLQDEIAKEYRDRGIDLVPDSTALSSHKDRFYEITEGRVA
tara:strand:+ start:952 stop:1320 length:369 start_codon:yes stop_codon:yes gene_type:complete